MVLIKLEDQTEVFEIPTTQLADLMEKHRPLEQDLKGPQAEVKIKFQQNVWGQVIHPSLQVINDGWIRYSK